MHKKRKNGWRDEQQNLETEAKGRVVYDLADLIDWMRDYCSSQPTSELENIDKWQKWIHASCVYTENAHPSPAQLPECGKLAFILLVGDWKVLL